MEDKIIKLFLCECDCKSAINEIIHKYNIAPEDYEEVLTEIKEWINFVIEY